MESLGTINLIKQIVKDRDPPKEVEIIRKRFDSKLSKLQENKTNNLVRFILKIIFKIKKI